MYSVDDGMDLDGVNDKIDLYGVDDGMDLDGVNDGI